MMRHVAFILVILFLAVAPLGAEWAQTSEAAAQLDLEGARAAALATVAAEPKSASAVAAAGWWLANSEALFEAEAILDAVAERRDPELGWLLSRIEARLNEAAPAGALTKADLSGPYGVFDALDLERGVVPEDDELPPIGTPWRSEVEPFRLLLASDDGWHGPPEALDFGGVYLVAWTLKTDRPVDGWLVVEAEGDLRLDVNDQPVDRRQGAGVSDPTVRWFHVVLEPGLHRIRAAVAGVQDRGLRLTLLDANGGPLAVELQTTAGADWATARVEPEYPPATRSALSGAEDDAATTDELLLAAAILKGHGNSRSERRLLDRAAERDPENPRVHLALARYFLEAPTGSAAEVDYRRSRDHLRRCRELPEALLVERALAHRQRRPEDAERLLGELVEEHPDDVRVIEMWVREAMARGWTREAEEGLEQLQDRLGSSSSVGVLHLEVLESLERWRDRNQLLETLAATEPASVSWVERLASECEQDQALMVLDRLRRDIDDPMLDAGVIRLLVERDDGERAQTELAMARNRWGDLPVFDDVALVLAADDDELDRVLSDALSRNPANLQLRTLAWRRGLKPFFQDYRVDALELAAERRDPIDGLDAILLLDQAVERIYANGASLHYYHGVTRALTPEGARRAAVLQQLPDAVRLAVRIIKPDGSIVIPPDLPLGQSTLELTGVGPGDLVEEEYVATIAPTGASRRGHMSPYIYRFADADRAFGLSEYVLLVPPEVELKVEGNFVGLERTEEDLGELHLVRWRAESVPPVPREPFAPPDQELLPWVTYGFGVTWEDVGDVVRDRFIPALGVSPELEDFTARHLQGDDPEAAVRRLVEALDDEMEPGSSLLEFNSTAGQSFSRRRSNRLGVLAGALVQAGWATELVLSRPRVFAGTHLVAPTLETFGAPLLRTSHDGRTVWVDLEENQRGVGRVRPVLQGSDGLVISLSDINAPVTYLDELPEFDNPHLEERLSASVTIDVNGRAHIQFVMLMQGPQGERLLQQVLSQPPDQVELTFRQVAVNIFAGAEAVRGAANRVDGGVELHLELEVPSACDVNGDRMTCRSLVLARPIAPALASLAQREFPLVLQVPFLQRFDLSLVPPDGWTVVGRKRLLETRYGGVDEDLEREGTSIRSILRRRLSPQTVAPQDYPEFARFCHAVDELVTRPPELVRGSGE